MFARTRRSGAVMWSWLMSPTGKTAIRYSVASAVAVGISQAVLFITFGVVRLASAIVCNIIASSVAAVPSYYLNRRWAWGKSGPSHLWKEVVPFWVLGFAGLGASIGAVDLAERAGRGLALSHLDVALVVNAASLAAFGVVWVVKFVIFHKLMFVDRPVARHGLVRVGTTEERETALQRSA